MDQFVMPLPGKCATAPRTGNGSELTWWARDLLANDAGGEEVLVAWDVANGENGFANEG